MNKIKVFLEKSLVLGTICVLGMVYKPTNIFDEQKNE